MSGEDDGDDSPSSRLVHEVLEQHRRRAGLSVDVLWLAYFELTGDAGPTEVEAYLQGLMPLPPLQVDILPVALRECVNGRDLLDG